MVNCMIDALNPKWLKVEEINGQEFLAGNQWWYPLRGMLLHKEVWGRYILRGGRFCDVALDKDYNNTMLEGDIMDKL